MNNLEIETLAQVIHLNARKEGPNENKVPALDVKMRGEIPIRTAALLMGVEDHHSLQSALWDQTHEDVPRRFIMLDEIKLAGEVWGVLVEMMGMRIPNTKIKKFSLFPMDGMTIELCWQTSVTEPPSKLLPVLAEYLGEDIKVRLFKEQQELDLGQGEAA